MRDRNYCNNNNIIFITNFYDFYVTTNQLQFVPEG